MVADMNEPIRPDCQVMFDNIRGGLDDIKGKFDKMQGYLIGILISLLFVVFPVVLDLVIRSRSAE